jgi:hypothetical protein
MTKRSRCIAVATLWCLLALATSASAECAWLLWEEQEITDTAERSQTSWRIESAEPAATLPGRKAGGYEFCQAQIVPLTKLLASQSQPGPTNPNVKEVQTTRGLVIVIFKGTRGEYGGQILTRFQCLPDTIDPHGPKGK